MHCLALTHDNKIYSWGVNDNGALGRETKKEEKSGQEHDSDSDDDDDDDDDEFDLNAKESIPAAIDPAYFGENSRFVQVAASDSASFVLTDTGIVYGWGTFSGTDGMIGFTKAGTLPA